MDAGDRVRDRRAAQITAGLRGAISMGRSTVLACVILLSLAVANTIGLLVAYGYWVASIEIGAGVVFAVLGLGLLVVPLWRHSPSRAAIRYMAGAGAALIVVTAIVFYVTPISSFLGFRTVHEGWYVSSSRHEWGSECGASVYALWASDEHCGATSQAVALQAVAAGTGVALLIAAGALHLRARRLTKQDSRFPG